MRASDLGLLLRAADSTPGEGNVHVFTGGDDTILKPAEASVVLVVPDQTNGNNFLLKASPTDTGIDLHGKMPGIWAVDDADVSFILNGTAGERVGLLWLREA